MAKKKMKMMMIALTLVGERDRGRKKCRGSRHTGSNAETMQVVRLVQHECILCTLVALTNN